MLSSAGAITYLAHNTSYVCIWHRVLAAAWQRTTSSALSCAARARQHFSLRIRARAHMRSTPPVRFEASPAAHGANIPPARGLPLSRPMSGPRTSCRRGRGRRRLGMCATHRTGPMRGRARLGGRAMCSSQTRPTRTRARSLPPRVGAPWDTSAWRLGCWAPSIFHGSPPPCGGVFGH